MCMIALYNLCLCSIIMESCLLCLLRNCKVPDSSEMNRSLTDSRGTEISELFSALEFKSLLEEIMST